MMKEIGGYFGLEQLVHKPYYPDLVAVNTARNALLYLLLAKKIKKLYVPSFLCDSVPLMLDREGIPYEYYCIGPDFMPVFDRALGSDEFLYVVNYYGQVTADRVAALKRRHGNVILDNVQAFFQRPVCGVDTVYSCRKFFGVPDGGYVSTDAVLPADLPRDISMERMRHILGRYEGASASDYYSDFKANDKAFGDLELRTMSALSENLLGAIDYEAARQRRNENYAVLARLLGERNPLSLTVPDGPYAYPFYCKGGMELKKRLAAEKIFVATLWPNVLDMEGTLEKDYAENILPLPCDQRYGETEMLEICRELFRLI